MALMVNGVEGQWLRCVTMVAMCNGCDLFSPLYKMLTGVKKAIYDELYVTDGSTLTRIDGSGAVEADITALQATDASLQTQITSNDASMSSNFATLGADVVALTSSKQDTIAALSVVNTTQLLKNNIMRPLKQASDNSILITDMGTQVQLRVPPDTDKQNVITASLPLVLSNDTLSIDLTSKQDVMSATAPIQIQNNTIGIDLGNMGHITCGNITGSTVTCNSLYGGVINQLTAQFVSSEQLYSREPAFNTSADLVKTLNIPQASMVLGLSNAFLNRIAATELSPFHAAGAVDASSGTPVILASKGRYGFTVSYGAVGVYDINFNTNHPDSAFIINISSQQNDHFFRQHNSVSNGFVNTGFRIYLTTRSNVSVDVPFCFSVIA
jgi:hypothetical protein